MGIVKLEVDFAKKLISLSPPKGKEICLLWDIVPPHQQEPTTSAATPPPPGVQMGMPCGYSVETLVHRDDAWIVPFAIRVSDYDGELYAVDEANSNILKITPPLSR
ncbi:hypothetical protein MLD38_029506 [Melastoma candidum]|uniref:Uncharacterized protein n=1 Tax=Melastoma candidum TaxID=119954 RepID=A0ACB9N4U8_9MYRT|nr:hypothetical protein MLD38_029506 [Melastoma candidum]